MLADGAWMVALPSLPCKRTATFLADSGPNPLSPTLQDKVALPSLLCKYTVVLTTYGTLAMEAPAKPEPKASKKQQQQQQQSKEEDEAAEKVGNGAAC
eukprot:477994-Pelagomonas_calceolata.AAC.6